MDISEYLKLKTETELHHRLANEYKQGKAYRYMFYYNPTMREDRYLHTYILLILFGCLVVECTV